MTMRIDVFKGREIRRTLHNNEWWFSVIDVIGALTGNKRPRKYWSDLKKKLLLEGFEQLSEKIGQLKLQSPDGKYYATDCANTETMFRIIQAIPSPKAEPLKRWLAKVGYERVQEIEDSELGTIRTRELYRAKGYSEDWIEKRMRGIAIRAELTDEWKNRDVGDSREYAILTAEIESPLTPLCQRGEVTIRNVIKCRHPRVLLSGNQRISIGFRPTTRRNDVQKLPSGTIIHG